MWQDTWSERAIGAAIAVHRQLGPGLLEQIYEACLCEELREQRIPFEAQKGVPIRYGGLILDPGMRLDLLIGGELVVELKSVERLTDIHDAQLLTYMRMGGYPVGLLMNFNVRILKNGIRRRVLGAPE
jgi:GxxExxY protein